MNGERIVNLIFFVLFAALAAIAVVFLYRDYQHWNHLENQQALLENRLAEMEQERLAREEAVEKLKADPEYIEKVIREKLSYAKEDEVIFRFE